MMSERIAQQRQYFVTEKKHHAFRQQRRDSYALAQEFARQELSLLQRACARVHAIIDREIPVVFEDERIALMRTVPETPSLFTRDEYKILRAKYWIHESGDFNNFCPNYTRVITAGFDAMEEEIAAKKAEAEQDTEKTDFLNAMLDMIRCLRDLCDRYRQKAEEVGNAVVAQTLARVPAKPARTLLEAMQFVRILNYGLWSANNYQCSLGRIDQTLFPFYQKDIADGVLDQTSALELVEEFFLCFNRDSDLYDGIQQGDNGQSLVLGGKNEDGSDSYNELSALMLQASLDLKLIDPKINLRVDGKTPMERYIKATELTREGLGFPQYMNDDINIPALLDWGYDPCDAYNYADAACWEPIIPNCGTEIVNADGLNFPASVLYAVQHDLKNCEDYDAFERVVLNRVRQDTDSICDRLQNLFVFPAPMASFMMDGGIEHVRDAAKGLKYQNIGIHGVGISTAADSLAAIKKFVFETKEISPDALISALDNNFAGTPEIKNRLRYDAPKMGNDDDGVDEIATRLLDAFADALANRKTSSGGVFRAGTGTAMYYIWFGRDIPATPDGRMAGDPLPANDSPSLFAKTRGPISVVKSFTKQHLRRAANGGPLTIELHDSVFHAPDSVEKVAQLVRLFINRGGHQLQINSVNREDMLRAQKHPEEYKNMIVRVWGWSGYFVELDREYQDQIIQRSEFAL